MGQDKARLPWNNGTLLGLALRKLRAVCQGTVYICASRADLGADAPVIPDAAQDAGPLGGIVAALAASPTEWGLFLPVDLPLLPVRFLRDLLERAFQGTALAMTPLLEGRPQPLCAAYHRDLLPGLQQALRQRKYKVMEAVQMALADTVGPSGMDHLVVPPQDGVRWFLNLNTPQEVEQARSLFSSASDIF